MTGELYALLAAVLLGLVHLTAASFSFKAQVGNKYTVGPRDEGLAPVGVAARLHRANANFLETFPYFAACTLIVRLADASGTLSQIGCVLYLVGRLAFLPALRLRCAVGSDFQLEHCHARSCVRRNTSAASLSRGLERPAFVYAQIDGRDHSG